MSKRAYCAKGLMKEKPPNQEIKEEIRYLKLSELSQEILDDIAKEFQKTAGGNEMNIKISNLSLDNVKSFLEKKGKASYRWGASNYFDKDITIKQALGLNEKAFGRGYEVLKPRLNPAVFV